MPRWLTPKDAANRLSVSESTVWRMLRRGQLASVKVGGRRRISLAAIRQANRPGARVERLDDLPPLTIDDPLFKLAGQFRSGGRGPGAADKHAILGARR